VEKVYAATTMQKGARNHDSQALLRARKLRKEMAVSERVLWAFLRKKQTGFLFKTQVAVDVYVLDFYCPEAKLCVEVDGEQHAQRRGADAIRDRTLLDLGIATIRVPSLDLFEETSLEIGRRLEKITLLCEERSGRARF